MNMTPESAAYFERVAGEWDQLRSGYFSEAVRAAAIRKAYLRPEFAVADVGAGTGFMAAGLAPLVRQVAVIDGSPAMLAVARRNLSGFANMAYYEADGLALPLPDASQDAVFASMYLHHCPDPLAAIRELTRLLRPGGRLVIIDLDSHAHAWLKSEMADLWQGFERHQVRDWFRQAGLANVIIDSTGESCCAAPQRLEGAAAQAEISIFVAVGTRRVEGVRASVRESYAAAAAGNCGCVLTSSDAAQEITTAAPAVSSACCGAPDTASAGSPACCGAGSSGLIALEQLTEPAAAPVEAFPAGYTPEQLAQAPESAAEFSLGCGNPLALAQMRPGEVVVDIGSGGGLDAFLAARQVGPTGRVIGVDMTPAMLERARRAAEQAGLQQVEFRAGQAEALPLEAGSADWIISNCVINLTDDKGQVFAEAYRVLKPGGRLSVSDVVTGGSFPAERRANPQDWSGCVFGALPEQEYLDLIAQAGFSQVQVRRSPAETFAGVPVYSLAVTALKA
jgi:arsenite methyltransferase